MPEAAAGTLPVVLHDLLDISPVSEGRAESLLTLLAAATPEEYESLILEHVRDQIASVLGHESAEEVESDRILQEMGFDSISAVELRNRLAASTGLPLPILALIDNPTPQAIGRYLLNELTNADGELDTGRDGGNQGDVRNPPLNRRRRRSSRCSARRDGRMRSTTSSSCWARPRSSARPSMSLRLRTSPSRRSALPRGRSRRA